ncbi:MAG: hypothetical protein ACRDOK_22130 [Streptosporangiaceae bacterium]
MNLVEPNLAARERILGPDDPLTLESGDPLARSYQLAGRFEQAVPLHINLKHQRCRVNIRYAAERHAPSERRGRRLLSRISR